MTSVLAFGAAMLVTCVSAAATAAVGPFAYLTIRLPVQAASAAVSGFPSDHFPPGLTWNVQVSPSDDCVQLVAQSPSSFSLGPYCTSWGYSITKALYDCDSMATNGFRESM